MGVELAKTIQGPKSLKEYDNFEAEKQSRDID